ncbi:MAG: hypothetical protein R2932_34015 [Caldilineaceae bacterium]
MTRNEIFNVVKSAMISIIDEIDETTEINESDRMATWAQTRSTWSALFRLHTLLRDQGGPCRA